jgi:hypothetical protein
MDISQLEKQLNQRNLERQKELAKAEKDLDTKNAERKIQLEQLEKQIILERQKELAEAEKEIAAKILKRQQELAEAEKEIVAKILKRQQELAKAKEEIAANNQKKELGNYPIESYRIQQECETQLALAKSAEAYNDTLLRLMRALLNYPSTPSDSVYIIQPSSPRTPISTSSPPTSLNSNSKLPWILFLLILIGSCGVMGTILKK